MVTIAAPARQTTAEPLAIALEGLSHWYGTGSMRRQVLQGVLIAVGIMSILILLALGLQFLKH